MCPQWNLLGISNAYLSQLEKGIRTHPSAELLDKIVKCNNINNFFFIFPVLKLNGDLL